MAPPRRARPFGARPRRGSVERPINAQMVRGTWLLVALPLLLAAFTVARPQPLPPPTLPPAFDAATAEQLTRELTREYPDRAPGSSGALGAISWVSEQLELYGYRPQTDSFAARIPGRGTVRLQNLVVVVQGASERTIVITAHRDNGGTGGANDNASGTAALIELARAYAPAAGTGAEPPLPSHRLVFVSTDGGAFGALGAARFAETSAYRDEAVAVISLDAVAGLGAPRLLITGDTARSPAASLVRTAATRVLEQSGEEPAHASALRQLLDLGFPFTLGEQGPFVAHGVPALTLTTLPDAPSGDFGADRFSAERLGGARSRSAESCRLARRRVGAGAGNNQLHLPGDADHPGLGNSAGAARSAAAVRDRLDRPLRALPPSPHRAWRRSVEPTQPAALLGVCGSNDLRGRRARCASRRRGSAAPTRCGRLHARRRSSSARSPPCCSAPGWWVESG